MADSVSPAPSSAPEQGSRSPLPWIFFALWFVWLLTMAWMARGEFTKVRATHERERVLQPQGPPGVEAQ